MVKIIDMNYSLHSSKVSMLWTVMTLVNSAFLQFD